MITYSKNRKGSDITPELKPPAKKKTLHNKKIDPVLYRPSKQKWAASSITEKITITADRATIKRGDLQMQVKTTRVETKS